MTETKTTPGSVELEQLKEKQIAHDMYKMISKRYQEAVMYVVQYEAELRTCKNRERQEHCEIQSEYWSRIVDTLREQLTNALPTGYPGHDRVKG